MGNVDEVLKKDCRACIALWYL